jgi:PGF-pre-PGF domain-containing protein
MVHRKALIPIIILLALMAIAAPVAAATITVSGNSSSTALSSAVAGATDGDTIVLGAGTYFEHDITFSGKSLTIQAADGHGPSDTIIDAQSAGRIFNVTDSSSLTISSLALRNGKAANGAAGANTDGSINGGNGSTGGSGGAILSAGAVTVTTSTITGCSAGTGGNGGATTGGTRDGGKGGAGGNGGAISATGAVTVTTSTLTGCSAGTGGTGGGSFGGRGGTGGTGGSGGAISATGTVTITGSTITGCSAGSGGPRGTGGAGIASGGNGGAIFTTGTVTVTTSTITGCSTGSPNPDDPDHLQQGLGVAVYSNGGSVHFCRLVNVLPTNNVAVYGSGSIDATDNWWGANSTPSAKVSSSVTYNPWLVLGITASPASIDMATTSVIRANLTYRSTGTDRSSSGTVPDGIPVAFSSAGGTFASGAGNITSGANATRFTPSASGSARISAMVDSETVSTSLTVLPAASFTASPASGTAPLTVQFTDTSQGSPVSWSWYFGSFNTTDIGVSTSQNPLHTYDTAGTYTVTLRVNSTPGNYVYKTGTIAVTSSGSSGGGSGSSGSGSSSSSGSSGSSGSDSSDGGGSSSSGTPGTANANVGGNSAVNTVTVTGTGVNSVIITGTQRDTLPSGVPQAAPGAYQYIELTPARAGSISGATISFTVPVSWLEEHGLTTADVAMTRYHDGTWVTLPTTFNGVTNGIASYSAQSPGFSLFAIVPAKGAAQESGTVSLSCPVVRAPATCPVCPGISAGSQVLSSGAVAVTQTSAVPAPAMPGTSVPLATIALAGTGCMVLIGSGWYVRRWWIQRQNPGLFREYD